MVKNLTNLLKPIHSSMKKYRFYVKEIEQYGKEDYLLLIGDIHLSPFQDAETDPTQQGIAKILNIRHKDNNGTILVERFPQPTELERKLIKTNIERILNEFNEITGKDIPLKPNIDYTTFFPKNFVDSVESQTTPVESPILYMLASTYYILKRLKPKNNKEKKLKTELYQQFINLISERNKYVSECINKNNYEKPISLILGLSHYGLEALPELTGQTKESPSIQELLEKPYVLIIPDPEEIILTRK